MHLIQHPQSIPQWNSCQYMLCGKIQTEQERLSQGKKEQKNLILTAGLESILTILG